MGSLPLLLNYLKHNTNFVEELLRSCTTETSDRDNYRGATACLYASSRPSSHANAQRRLATACPPPAAKLPKSPPISMILLTCLLACLLTYWR